MTSLPVSEGPYIEIMHTCAFPETQDAKSVEDLFHNYISDIRIIGGRNVVECTVSSFEFLYSITVVLANYFSVGGSANVAVGEGWWITTEFVDNDTLLTIAFDAGDPLVEWVVTKEVAYIWLLQTFYGLVASIEKVLDNPFDVMRKFPPGLL